MRLSRAKRGVGVLFLALAGIVVVAGGAWAAPEGGAAPAAAPCPPCTPKAGHEKDCTCYTCACRKPGEAKCPPKYENLRFEENWKPCLCVPACDRPDWSDRHKANSLDRCNSIWVDTGGQVRVRYEGWINQAFGAAGAAADDAWGLLRLRAHADVHVGTWGRVFVEGIYADQWERELGARPIDRNRGDFLNCFGEVHGNVAGAQGLLRFGRMELQEGKQRLISPLDWSNTRRTFDGVFGRYQRGHQRLDAFATKPVKVLPTELDDWFGDSIADAFWGLYYTNRIWTCRTWELYVLGLHRETAKYGAVTGDEDRYTVGGRIGGEIPKTAFDYDIEVALQFGTFGGEDILAGMVSMVFGWKPCWTCWDERIAIGLDYASGDDSGDAFGTFNQLYPLGHAYLGYMDLIGRQNVVSGHLLLETKPLDKLTLAAAYFGFWRASDTDAVYNAAGGVLRGAAAGNDELFVGSELDLYGVWTIDRHWKVTGGYCHFFPGDFIDTTGPSGQVDFFWLDAQFTF